MSRGTAPRKLKTFDDDDIVRYSVGPDVPIVGLVRDRSEYKEMREMALITGMVLGLGSRPRAPRSTEPPAEEAAAAPVTEAVEPAKSTAAPHPSDAEEHAPASPTSAPPPAAIADDGAA